MRPIRKWLALLLSAYSIFLIIFNLYYRNFTEANEKRYELHQKSNKSHFHQVKILNNTKHLREQIIKTNNEQNIHNFHFIKQKLDREHSNNRDPFVAKTEFKPPSIQFLVIVIQVHNRVSYLKELIESLRNTKHIEDALVIFSHDVYANEINDLIRGIDFCATLQIFYPFSAQIYVDRFPGKDPRDCNKSMSRTKAKESNCTNADYPDMYGHYREHDVVQIKHHWFWKISYVFEELKVAGGLRDLQVLFLEEDHFVMPDAIQVLRKLSEK